MGLHQLARLLRVSLLPSALADGLAGLVVGSHGELPEARLFLWLPASAALYHGGMALNDWADRHHDAATRPDRPIPSGAVPAALALSLGLGLLAMGVLLGALAHPWLGWGGLGLASLVAAYDLVGRGPLLGPLLLGSCRSLNLGLPLVVAAETPAPGLLLLTASYGAWVALVSTFARAEDGEAPLIPARQQSLLLACAASLPIPALTAGVVLGEPLGGALGALLAASAAAAPLAAWRASEPWTRGRVEATVGLLLRRLLVVTASVTLVTCTLGRAGLPAALVILGGYPLARQLRRVAPPS
ncbi:MAG: UbiA family prenyltransferase [Planctomycetota bacterium]|nr:UbiA family prenyltransferase [Planctomycetota bacterium]